MRPNLGRISFNHVEVFLIPPKFFELHQKKMFKLFISSESISII